MGILIENLASPLFQGKLNSKVCGSPQYDGGPPDVEDIHGYSFTPEFTLQQQFPF